MSERLDQCKALGFDSIEAAEAHHAWLLQTGTPEFRAWLAGIPQNGVQAATKLHFPPDEDIGRTVPMPDTPMERFCLSLWYWPALAVVALVAVACLLDLLRHS